MIFKQVDEILSGRKTQTRRVCKPGQIFAEDPWKYDEDKDDVIFLPPGIYIGDHGNDDDDEGWIGRALYLIGRTYAVVPKRGKPAVWWHSVGGLRYYEEPVYSEGYDLKAYYMQNGWQELRIRITAIRRERLQSITEADARAEGVADVGEYRELWNSINKRKGTRWEDNPEVFVIAFELVTED